MASSPSSTEATRRIPDGPRGRGLRNFVARLSTPLEFYAGLLEQYGKVFRYDALNLDIWCVNEPAMIQQVLVSKANAFHKSPVLKRTERLFGNSVLVSDGKVHARQRRLVAPAFHRERIENYARIMADEVELTQKEWADGQTVAMHEAMHHLTLHIVAGTLFGSSVSTEVRRIAESVDLLVGNFHLFFLPLINTWLKLPLPKMSAMRSALGDLDTIIYKMITERRADPTDRGDLLSMLLAAQDEQEHEAPLSDREVRDQAMTLFLAGHETTANAMNWAWYLLAKHPEIEARLDEELRRELGDCAPTFEDVSRLGYARAVMAEAMRLYPPVWIIAREAIEDVTIGEYDMPKGAMVVMLQWAVHRDERWWPDPLAFRPERWLEEAPADRPKFAYFPFGGGARICAGESFAWMEGVLILASIARRWRMKLPADYPDPPPCSAQITLRPAEGLPMVLEAKTL